ncbi:lysosomal Cystine transporter [Allomyces macrogynus ATCC 38327]|uniref:Lysosomal Cystine transporter n=1 Tax=Allomyces macrogynus (strain ATCC 38327) TaxID=578462 RepID=A0A0L0SSC4_ALLM3|nr:lysosomal Cystine transporter [Allomyces macrogynus ATCC 38327]|eukprot:KNE65396.1 lysosomal Cystine transporter [Allomyces macrogynus ATCC 38327]
MSASDIVTTDPPGVPVARAFSAILGWTYFAAWSISFWPQVILNFRRKSVEGLSLDFLSYNIVGFTCYSIYTVSFFASEVVQDQYRARNNGASNLVAPNDVVFAVHAWIMTIVTGIQAWRYHDKATHSLSVMCKVVILAAMGSIATFLIAMVVKPSIEELDLMNFLGSWKLGMSLIKYLPQMFMNYRNKSTAGWSIHNILLDATGGTLSLVQLFLDAWIAWRITDGPSEGWVSRALSGNGTKLGLSLLSLVFDVIFIVQHYVLYRASWRDQQRRGSRASSEVGITA